MAATLGGGLNQREQPGNSDVAPFAEDEDEEETGSIAQELVTAINGTNLTTSEPATNLNFVSSAWIKRIDSSNGASGTQGEQLVAFSTSGSTPRVRTSFSGSYTATTPTWSTVTRSEGPTGKWPTPANVCEVYGGGECGGSPTWPASGHYDTAIQALWTGLDGVAAVVTTCGLGTGSLNQNVDICLGVSVNGGASFTRTQILSVNAADGTSTGGRIDPPTATATLAWFGERTNGLAGEVALPIYVSWRNDDGLGVRKWWFTRVLVGSSGTVAETTIPRELAPVPNVSGDLFSRNRATVFGYRVSGLERIAVAFSDHVAEGATVNCNTSAPPSVDPKDSVTWKVSQSEDMGLTWGCFEGTTGTDILNSPNPACFANSSSGATTIATDPSWDLCAGLSRSPVTAPNSTIRTVNDSRPNVAMNVNSESNSKEYEIDKTWFFALNHNMLAPDGKLHAHVYRGGGSPVQSPLADSTFTEIKRVAWSNVQTAQTDSWQQSITVHSGGFLASRPPKVIMSYMAAFNADGGTPAGMKVRSLVFTNPIVATVPLATLEEVELTPATTAMGTRPMPFQADISGFTAVSVFQGCTDFAIDNCPGSQSGFLYPAIPFVAAWPDSNASAKVVNDVFARGFGL